ncbi:MAG: hypothetical protein HKN08_09750 [Gammaproteobacteria bacterium]|nr:hypothetical protein [Gammaproteobacteria bacterium]
MLRPEKINQTILSILMLGLFASSGLAHTTNEATLFPDIKQSDARFDVILLVGIGIVPETEKFNPGSRLSRIELGAWGALAHGLVVPETDQAPNVKALAISAVDSNVIDHLNGNASYEAINQVLFNGVLQLDNPSTMPTRAQAAEFIVANLETNYAGETLLSSLDMEMGPVGKVVRVETKMNPDGGETFYLTIGEESYAVYSHGKVANGPVDLKQWKDKNIRRSVVQNLGQFKLWVFLEASDS